MPKRSLFLIPLPILLAVMMAACAPGQTPQETPTPPPVVSLESDSVSAEAFVVPPQEADLAFETGGRVVEVLVEEGDTVTAGQALARLDDTNLREAVEQAEAGLVSAEAQLAKAQATATPEQIAQSEAAVSRAEAGVAQAEAGLARAEASLAQLVTGATAEEIAIAQARLDTLIAQLNQALAGARPETVEASAASVLQAEAAVRLAQAEYDKVAYAVDPLEGQPAAVALQDATLKYQAAKANHAALLNGATLEEIAILEAQVAEGRAALAQAQADPTPEQIAGAQAAVLEAEAGLAQAQAGLEEAEAGLAQLLAGATDEDIAIAEAAVLQAEVALANARAALEDAQITAPFAGTVANLDIEVGEFVSPGVPVLTLADVSHWQIETDDLTEIDVVHVREGQPVAVSIDALPDDEFQGSVARIKPRSETKAGDVTYTVVIALDGDAAGDPRLRWGMTTLVDISTR
ncbi:MAG: efflux RND transporter periplasmic adaptor subunit [Anaerolineae bacterium]